jgi:DNA mismatch repair protein MSH6
MNARTKGTKQDKTVKREICRITTPGTKTFNLLDSDVANAFSQYLLSIVEKVKNLISSFFFWLLF